MKKQLNESTNKTILNVLSALRLKNNELQNRITEMNSEFEKLRDENKTLKRLHHREEIAIQRLENQENDVTKMIQNHNNEVTFLKKTLKAIKIENRKLNASLADKDTELRAIKKKYDETKKILNEKKIMDSVELAKKLEEAERDINYYRKETEVIESLYIINN
jgi:chromosome segregation ATPase